MNLKNETGAAMAASRSAYEAKVGVEAVLRSGGKNPQLKGVVHEILYRDALTMKPGNLATVREEPSVSPSRRCGTMCCSSRAARWSGGRN